MTPVEFRFLTPTGNPISDALVEIQLSKGVIEDLYPGVVMPRLITATTDQMGLVTVDLFPATVPYMVSVYDSESEAGLFYKFYVPELAAGVTYVRLQDIVVDREMSNTSYDEAALLSIHEAKANAISASTSAKTFKEAAEAASLASQGVLAQANTIAADVQAAKTLTVTKSQEAQASATASAQSATESAGSATTASTKAAEASTSSTLAQSWATQATGEVVSGQGYSAKKYSQDAAGSASAAFTSATQASVSATTATAKATDAAASATIASTKATAASASATTAEASATQAIASATEASASATTASTKASEASTSAATATAKATVATDKAAAASVSATSAATSAYDASVWKQAADTFASNAATSAATATSKASEATTQANLATDKASAALANANQAEGFKNQASTSATNAAASASLASTKATAAETSATQASTQATAAAASASAAMGSQTVASTKASEAATSATNSANSATASQTSATNAATSASNAATSATSAATQASNAATSATASANSATASANSAASALNLYGSMSAVNTAVSSASTSATNAATSATNAANSATQAAASASSAAALVLGSASNLPSIAPSLNLDFANSKQLDPRITFSRASTAAYYDSKATTKAEENLLTYLQAIGGTNWTKVNGEAVTLNAVISPDGATTATKIAGSNVSGYHGIYQGGITLQAGLYYTISVYAKAAEYSLLSIADCGNGAFSATFDLANGTTGALVSGANRSVAIAAVGNGWYRCSLTISGGGASSSGVQFAGYPSSATINPFGAQYTGDGTSGIYVWGAQLEQRAFPTAYTPTTASPITNYIPVLQTAANNAARIDHDPVTGECKGLLIEEQRTNLLSYSSDFDAWAKNYTSVRANVAIAPDGTLTADNLVENTSSSPHGVYRAVLDTISSGVTYTTSVFVKSAGRNKIRLVSYDFSTDKTSVFDLASGTVTSSNAVNAAITPAGNGWYRVAHTFTSTATGGSLYSCQVYLKDAVGNDSYAGDGYSGIYIWGAQLEAGTFATSYIPTALTYSGRASTATYQGDDGFLATAAVNAPRYQRNAQGGKQLLLEGAGTNLLMASERFSDPAWSTRWGGGATVYPNDPTFISPSGTQTVAKVVATNGGSGVGQVVTLTAGVTYTLSAYINTPSGNVKLQFSTAPGGSATEASVSVAPSTILTKYSVTYTPSITQTYYVGVNDTVSLQTFYIWGAQLETGSVATSYMPSVDTFTSRSSTATYFDSTGVLRTAPANAPRYGYGYDASRAKWVSQGLLVEASATNLLTYSDQFDNWGVYESTVSSNATASPDGSATADKIVESTAYSYHLVSRGFVSSIGSTNTVSFYAKAGGRSFVYSRVSGALIPDAGASFNLSAGTVNNLGGVVSAGIQPVGNGWFRCFYTLPTLTASSGTLYFFPAADGVTAGNQNPYYTGDGTSGIYLWGAQLEIGSVATSYIPTTTTQVTRAADSATSVSGTRAADVYSSAQATRVADAASMTGANFSNWYRADEGSLYAEATAFNNGAPMQIDDGTTSNRLYVTARPNGVSGSSGAVIAGGATQADLGSFASSSTNKLVLTYKANDFAGTSNGASIATDTSGSVPFVDRARFFNNTVIQASGYVKKLSYYPKRLSNSELQALTA